MNLAVKPVLNKYCLIIPGRGYARTAEHSKPYKEKIKKIARQKIPQPFNGEVEIRLEYLYHNPKDRLDGDNLLKTICDALEGVAYKDDSQVVHHEADTINTNRPFKVRGIPLNLQIADLFASGESFAIIRLRLRTIS